MPSLVYIGNEVVKIIFLKLVNEFSLYVSLLYIIHRRLNKINCLTTYPFPPWWVKISWCLRSQSKNKLAIAIIKILSRNKIHKKKYSNCSMDGPSFKQTSSIPMPTFTFRYHLQLFRDVALYQNELEFLSTKDVLTKFDWNWRDGSENIFNKLSMYFYYFPNKEEVFRLWNFSFKESPIHFTHISKIGRNWRNGFGMNFFCIFTISL